jgi:hypothetical protein
MGTSTKDLARRLYDLASGQGGFFTAAQAVSVGYADSVHGYHLNKGDWERAGRGIYRLTQIPRPKWSRLFVLLLWSRGKDGTPQGVFCRETALLLHEDGANICGIAHMIVPPGFRRNTSIPEDLQLYSERLSDGDIQICAALPVTSLSKTMKDLGREYINPKISLSDHQKGTICEPAGLRSGEWSPGVSFLQALERGED